MADKERKGWIVLLASGVLNHTQTSKVYLHHPDAKPSAGISIVDSKIRRAVVIQYASGNGRHVGGSAVSQAKCTLQADRSSFCTSKQTHKNLKIRNCLM